MARVLLLAAVVFLAAGLIAPWINAARFGMPIQGAIEESLGRKVAFEEAYFSVFSGPGFSLRNVTISEDARYGIEPFAYVPTLEARLRLDKLLAGKLRFASLRLMDPTLSLVNGLRARQRQRGLVPEFLAGLTEPDRSGNESGSE